MYCILYKIYKPTCKCMIRILCAYGLNMDELWRIQQHSRNKKEKKHASGGQITARILNASINFSALSYWNRKGNKFFSNWATRSIFPLTQHFLEGHNAFVNHVTSMCGTSFASKWYLSDRTITDCDTCQFALRTQLSENEMPHVISSNRKNWSHQMSVSYIFLISSFHAANT